MLRKVFIGLLVFAFFVSTGKELPKTPQSEKEIKVVLDNSKITIDSVALNKLVEALAKETKPDAVAQEIQKNELGISAYNNTYKWWTFWGIPLVSTLVSFGAFVLTFIQLIESNKRLRISEEQRIEDLKIQEKRKEEEQEQQKNTDRIAEDDALMNEILAYLSLEKGSIAYGTFLAMKFNRLRYTDGFDDHVKNGSKAYFKIMWDFFCLEANYYKSHHSYFLNKFLRVMPEIWDDDMKTDGDFAQFFQSQELAIKKVLASPISTFYSSWIEFKKSGEDYSGPHEREYPDLTYLAQIIVNNLLLVSEIIPENSKYKDVVEKVCERAYGNKEFYECLVKKKEK